MNKFGPGPPSIFESTHTEEDAHKHDLTNLTLPIWTEHSIRKLLAMYGFCSFVFDELRPKSHVSIEYQATHHRLNKEVSSSVK